MFQVTLLCSGVEWCYGSGSSRLGRLGRRKWGSGSGRGEGGCGRHGSKLHLCVSCPQDEDIFRAIMDNGRPDFSACTWDNISQPAKV